MTYFKDLTPYEYSASYEPHYSRLLNIGWLDRKMPFQKGFTGQEFKEKLLRFCSDEFIVNLCRGYHTCEFCNLSDSQWYNEQNGKYKGAHWASIGNGEIRVLGSSAVYVAPALIYHYVSEHQYRPPDEFIEAVLAGEADSKEQKELLSGYSR